MMIHQPHGQVGGQVSLAKDNIRVNVLCPGVTVTNFVKESKEERQAAAADTNARLPIGRPAKPIEIAYGALFLASDESSYVIGHTLVVDGGSLA